MNAARTFHYDMDRLPLQAPYKRRERGLVSRHYFPKSSGSKNMTATFHLQPGELNQNFLEKLNAMFRDREVEVVIHEPEESDYPSRNPAQERFLMEALDRVERGEGLVYVDVDELRRQNAV